LIPTRELADAFGISKGTIDFAITLLRDAALEEPSRGSAIRVHHRRPRLDRAIA
jgi:DNA-binding GntR family transcriptional regulator